MENRVFFIIIAIAHLFAATNAAKCVAMRTKLSKQQCTPKIGHGDKVQPCINLCTKKLVPVKQCSKQPHCCIHNCACVMKGAGYFTLPKQFWSVKPSEFKFVDGCSPERNESGKEDQKKDNGKKISNSQQQINSLNKSSVTTKKAPRNRLVKKPVPTVSKVSRPTQSSKRMKQQVKARNPTRKTIVRTTSKKPRPRPTKLSNPTTTKKPCKKPSPFMNLFASRFSSFLSGIGFSVSNYNKPC